MSKQFTIICCAAIILLLLVNLYLDLKPASQIKEQNSSGTALIGGDFHLTDQNGKRVKHTDFHGKYMLVYFGYSFCPDICPVDLGIMSHAMNALGDKAALVTPVFITVDPERDTVEKMKNYLEHFHPSLVGLTGTQEEINQAVTAYRVYAKKVENPDMAEYVMDHSGFTYLMDKQGKYLTHFNHDTDPKTMADKIQSYINE